MSLRICAVTGSRADWGLLLPVLTQIRDHPSFDLQLIVTGSHFDATHGSSHTHITSAGFSIDQSIPLDLQNDNHIGISQSVAAALTGLAEAYDTLQPDLLLILGDRYEIFAAAQAALFSGIPVAHIAGGDISEGAFDDAMRHAISKLSHIHFTTNPDASKRLKQLGENPQHIYCCGSPGIDAIKQTPLLSKKALEERLGMALKAQNLAITFHSETLNKQKGQEQVRPLLEALANLDDVGLIFTGANADTDGLAINSAIKNFVQQHPNSCFHQSLGGQGYYSLVNHADLVVGNSSSGLYEAPTLNTATINIGIRQQGRLQAESVINCDNNSRAILTAINRTLKTPITKFLSPYGNGNAATCIINQLLNFDDYSPLLIKTFHKS